MSKSVREWVNFLLASTFIFFYGILIQTLYATDIVHEERKNAAVEQVISNLEKRLKKSPKDYDLIFTTARAHAIIFAKGNRTLEVSKNLDIPDLPEGIIGTLPIQVSVKSELSEGERKDHLKKAIEYYRKGISFKASIHKSRLEQEELGLAWCLQQLGSKHDALTIYRNVFNSAVAESQKQRKIDPQGVDYISANYRAAETSRYLLQLLHPAKDKKEIEFVKKNAPKNVVFKEDVTSVQTIE